MSTKWLNKNSVNLFIWLISSCEIISLYIILKINASYIKCHNKDWND